MSEKILERHLQLLAVIYIRQSSEGQVRNNRESYLVQQGLQKRATELGWHKDRVLIVDGDMGVSASEPGQREAFTLLLQQIRDGKIGIVFAVDVSRLARNNMDFSQLTHWCAMYGALVGDLRQVLNPASPQDGLLLGIQCAMAVHELHAIKERMLRGSQQKASRGELHLGIPAGYVVVENKHLRKHADARVQRAINSVFEKFEICVSVNQLFIQLGDENYRHPRIVPGSQGEQVEWVPVAYRNLMKMLKNPTYAGIYAYPRYQTKTRRSASGKMIKTLRATRRDEWQVELHDHQPAYLSAEKYHANLEKIAMNAQRSAPSGGAPRVGSALLSGLITCRHCQHRMHVAYSRKGQARYRCRHGERQRSDTTARAEGGCFSFAAEVIESQLAEQILWAVSPGGVAASELAIERLRAQRDSQRRLISDELSLVQYEADLTRRRFNNVDPANRLVFDTLAQELEVNLQKVELQTAKLNAFDQQCPEAPSDAERTRLKLLGGCLSAVWNDAQSDSGIKKQIVRLLIDHIFAEKDEATGEVLLNIKWHGGHHTTLRGPASRRREARWDAELPTLIETLRKLNDDRAIARILNRASIAAGPIAAGPDRSASAFIDSIGSTSTWTESLVRAYRERHDIVPYSSSERQRQGWLTQQQAATNLGISPMSINRLIEAQILSAEGESPFPRVIHAEELSREVVQAAVSRIKSHANAPLPTNPNQRTLDF